MTDKLLPCPFCGGEPTVEFPQDGYPEILCRSCYQAGTTLANSTMAEAIAAWNTRAQTVFGMALDEVWQMMKRDAERKRTCYCTTQESAWCFACSECGKSFPRYELHRAHNHGEINYCPNCGAKVVER